MSKNIVTPGNQFAEKGTTAWADWQRSRLKIALKDVNFEARQIVGIIRDMCDTDPPAWHEMTRENGKGFLTFEEFVTSPEGLAYGDYPKFRGMALSEPRIMNSREYDLLTATPAKREQGSRDKEESALSLPSRSTNSLRAIKRADPYFRDLFIQGMLSKDNAALLGALDPAKKAKAKIALKAVKSIRRNGSESVYRQAVNQAVRDAFGVSRPTALELAQKAYLKMSAQERKQFATWMGNHGKENGE